MHSTYIRCTKCDNETHFKLLLSCNFKIKIIAQNDRGEFDSIGNVTLNQYISEHDYKKCLKSIRSG